jgi:hypothetical protein
MKIMSLDVSQPVIFNFLYVPTVYPMGYEVFRLVSSFITNRALFVGTVYAFMV